MDEFERRKRAAETVEAVDVEVDGERSGGSHASFGKAVPEPHPLGEESRRLRVLSHILYGLYALSWFTGGFSGLVALIIDYVKRQDARGTAYEAIYASHATWRIRTFWGGLLALFIAAPFIVIHIGWFFLFLIGVWGLYRIIKGWLRLLDDRPMYR